jgi:hypothetical protein
MFIIELVYKVDLAQIDAHMREHMRFVNAITPRELPRVGTEDPARRRHHRRRRSDRAAIEAIARQDPFVTLGLADVRVIEFRASQRAKDIQARIENERS